MKGLRIVSVKTKDVEEWFTKKHYAKRVPSVSFCFSLLNSKGETIGVCSFGRPPMPLQRSGVCGKDFSEYVWELNRLITNDNLPKNYCSFFVSQCIKKMPKPCIILSYSDKDFGHNGYIYQATNFLFVGETQKHKSDISIKGSEHLHQSTITDKFRGVENRMEAIRSHYGDRLIYKKRTQKNRYIFLNGTKKQRKKFLKNLKYKVLPYPKGENKNYDASYIPLSQISLF